MRFERSHSLKEVASWYFAGKRRRCPEEWTTSDLFTIDVGDGDSCLFSVSRLLEGDMDVVCYLQSEYWDRLELLKAKFQEFEDALRQVGLLDEDGELVVRPKPLSCLE